MDCGENQKGERVKKSTTLQAMDYVWENTRIGSKISAQDCDFRTREIASKMQDAMIAAAEGRRVDCIYLICDLVKIFETESK